MFVTNYFMIGKVSIASTWIALILSFVVAYGVVRWKYGKTPATLLGDAIFYFFVVWKLSVILTDFKTVLQFPLSLLYFNGGTIGLFLGISAAGWKVFTEMRKGQLTMPHIHSLLFAVVIIQSMYQVLIVLLNDGPLMVQLVTAISFSLFALIVLFFRLQFQEMPYHLLLLLVGLQLFISVLQPAGLIQVPMLVAIGLAGMMAMMIYRYEKNHLEAIH